MRLSKKASVVCSGIRVEGQGAFPFGAGHAVLDLVRRSGSTKQKSDLMLTLSQAAHEVEV